MPAKQQKTYRPVLVNFDADLLGRLDEYQSSSISRTKHIHQAIELYLEHLERTGAMKSVWLAGAF